MRWLQGLSWLRVALIAGTAVALVLLGLVIRGLSAPVERPGSPTATVTALPPTAPSSASPTETSSVSPSASASGKTAPSASSPASTMKASGTFSWSKVSVPATGSVGTDYRYAVAVETSAKLKVDEVARFTAGVLNDPRSWTGDGKARFSLVGNREKATVEILLASTKTATALCGSDAESAYTCVAGRRIVINAERWKSPPPSYAGNPTGLRQFLVNHAVGHFLGEPHASCKAGKPAPVMMQQAADLRGCIANPWPN